MRRIALSLLALIIVFAAGVLVGQQRMMGVHDARVEVLQSELQSWKAHHLGVPVASLMTLD